MLKRMPFFTKLDDKSDNLTRMDDENLLDIVCYFVGIRLAKIGDVLTVTGKNISMVEILYSGSVDILEPTNQTSQK